MIEHPPPILDCARVLEYARVDASVRYSGRSTTYVGNKPIDPVPHLAVCQNMVEALEVFLFHCDENWNVLAAGTYSSSKEARECAEAAYIGISSKWIKSPFSIQDAEEFLSASFGEMRCAFCGRTPHHVHAMVQGKTGARICDLCLTELHLVLKQDTLSDN